MEEKSPVYFAAGDDPEIALAIKEAQRTFKYFWREVSWEYRRIVPAFNLVMIKAAFFTDADDSGECSVEHMWISQVEFDGVKLSGVLLNEPEAIAALHEGDEVDIPFAELEDWMLTYGDIVYGGFTVQALRKGMSPQERKEHDALWGLDFGDPATPRIIFQAPPAKKGLLGKFLGKQEAPAAFDFANPPEHPMSENMAEKLVTAVKDDPDAMLRPDENGWSLLHREALAGNLTPVRILLEHGADATVRNGNGHTPLDLAQLMGWDKVAASLSAASSAD